MPDEDEPAEHLPFVVLICCMLELVEQARRWCFCLVAVTVDVLTLMEKGDENKISVMCVFKYGQSGDDFRHDSGGALRASAVCLPGGVIFCREDGLVLKMAIL